MKNIQVKHIIPMVKYNRHIMLVIDDHYHLKRFNFYGVYGPQEEQLKRFADMYVELLEPLDDGICITVSYDKMF